MSFFGLEQADDLLESKYKYANQGQDVIEDDERNDETFGEMQEMTGEGFFNNGSMGGKQPQPQQHGTQGTLEEQMQRQMQMQKQSQPRRITIEGLEMNVLDISHAEKDHVYVKIRELQPMYNHLDTLISTISKLRGDIRRLQEIKQLIRIQSILVQDGIFVIKGADMNRLESEILDWFAYGESLIISNRNSNQAQSVPVEDESSSESSVESVVISPAESTSISPENRASPVDSLEEDAEEVVVVERMLDSLEFPSLGAVTLVKTIKDQPRLIRPNQKVRREMKSEQIIGVPRRDVEYTGMMLRHEVDLMAKIQISQLVTDDPFRDDYYFQMSTKPGTGKKSKSKKWEISSNQFLKTGVIMSNETQVKMKRLIEKRKATKPREESSVMEGALGKIGLKSNRAPKQTIQLMAQTPLASTPSPLDGLRYAEKVLSAVLEVEDARRRKVNESKDLKALWEILGPKDDVALASSLNHSKGLKAVSRALNIFPDAKQTLNFFKTMLNSLEILDVCKYNLGQENEKVEQFMSKVFPFWTTLIDQHADMAVVCGLTQTILERHDLMWLLKSRVGLTIMTMLLQRGELLKNAELLTIWTEIYTFIFASLTFPSLFLKNTKAEDEVYVWQFLSAMAISASGIEQQRILVTELRENIIQTAKTDHPKALENVNLFLTALDLNITAKQLAEMSS